MFESGSWSQMSRHAMRSQQKSHGSKGAADDHLFLDLHNFLNLFSIPG